MLPFILKPYDHQVKMVEFALTHSNCALFAEMGTGKSKSAVDIVRNRAIQDGVRKVLIICPKSILKNWEREILLNTGNSENVEVRILDGSKSQRVALLTLPLKRLCFFIINYEGVRILKDDLVNLDFHMIIADESTRIKNFRAARTKACIAVGKKVKYKLILSGMPVTQSPLDLHSQYLFLDNGEMLGWSYIAFGNKYFTPAIFRCPEKHVISNKNYISSDKVYCYRCGKWYPHSQGLVWKWECKDGALEEINKLIYQKAIRFTKSQCIDLPPKVYEQREIELNDEERHIYNDMNEKLKTEIQGEEIKASVILTKLLRLQQITSGYATDEYGVERQINNCTKLKELEDLLEEIGGKVVIWCKFIRNIKAITELLDSKNISYVTFFGETSVEDRDAAIQKFQNNSTMKVFVAQISTGGFGISLTAASTVVYFSLGYSLEEYEQSQDRCHRIGQVNKVTYINIIAQNTIDELVLKALTEKKSVADYVVNSWREERKE